MNRGARWVLTGGILGVLLQASGCMQTMWPKPPLPDFDQLQEGDIVLTFAGAIESWWLALCSGSGEDPNELPYTHAEAIYKDQQGRFMLGGVSEGRVRARPLADAMAEFEHVAVYRARLPIEQRRQLADMLEAWINDPEIQSAAFDYTMQDVPGRRDAFCCVGLLNEIYREKELDPPFVQVDWTPNAAAQHLSELLDLEINTIIHVDSIDTHAGYEKVLMWHNALVDRERSHLLEMVARQTLIWNDEGWRLKTSDKLHVGLALADLPAGIERTERTRSQLKLFSQDVLKMWARLKRRGALEGLNDEARAELLQTVLARFKDRYFYRVQSANTDGGVPASAVTDAT